MHSRKITSARILLLLGLGLCFRHDSVIAQSPAQVLSLSEITVTSFRGRLGTGKTLIGGTTDKHTSPPPGQPFDPLHLPPGTRLDIFGDDGTTHVLVAFPGIGGCMISESGSSLRLPEATETDMTVTFDRHITSPNLMLLNVNPAEVAKRGGAVFRTKNKWRSNSGLDNQTSSNLIFSTLGGRFFIFDSQYGQEIGGACTVGALDGSARVEELNSKQQATLNAGQVVVITAKGIGTPRAPTKAELSYDLGCKLAVLGREAPARLPNSMKTLAPINRPGTRVNSLGMVFVPVLGTKIHMCVHETRWQDFAAYVASMQPLPDGKPRGRASGLWGWDDHPVTTSWDEAQAFCTWLSQKEGKKYRLPTDEEWSRAVGIGASEKRGPATTPEDLSKSEVGTFPWGADWPPPAGSGNFGDASFHAMTAATPPDKDLALYDDGFAETAPVMSFKPNKFGIYDLAGNVAEWCEDWYNGARMGHLIRGSGYKEIARSRLHPSYRTASVANDAFVAGFRIVIEQP